VWGSGRGLFKPVSLHMCEWIAAWKNYSNIILPSTSTSTSSEWSLPIRFSDKHFVCISLLSHMCYTPRPSHTLWLDHPNNIWRLQVMKLLIMQCSPASFHLIPLRSTHSPQHLFSNTRNLCPTVSEIKFHTYKTMGKKLGYFWVPADSGDCK